MKASEILLSCENLFFIGPKGQMLLDAVSLEVKAGEKIAIVGPNGAGKSLLQRHLSGRLEGTCGSIKLLGRPIGRVSPIERAQMMAVMAQSEHIEPLLAVDEYISLGRIPYKQQLGGNKNNLEIERAIQLCGLDKLKRQSIQTLSGGERQRASLARAIAQSPDLLFLDEPTNHLDLRAKVDILDLIRELPTTVLAVIHELAMVEDFADRVIVLQNGKIIADGPPAVSLSKKIVWDVFEMNRVDVSHPISGKQLKVFEASEHQINL